MPAARAYSKVRAYDRERGSVSCAEFDRALGGADQATSLEKAPLVIQLRTYS